MKPGTELQSGEEGSVTLLIVALVVLVLMVVSVIIGITSVYQGYKKLQDLADQAALSVANDVRGLERAGEPAILLDDGRVRSLAADFLASSGAGPSFSQLGIASPTGIADADTAQVTLAAQAEIPFLSQIVPVAVPISATGTAQTVLER